MGVEFCTAFAREGAQVVLADWSEGSVKVACETLASRGYAVHPLVIDVADETTVRPAFDRLVRELGAIDVLVNGAGIRPVGESLDQPLADFEATLRINVTGVFICAREAGRHMVVQRSGSIINIASVNGVRGVTGMAAYCASKAAVISLTQTLASEWAPHGVRVNAILPAQVETPMIAEQVGAERVRREERIPLGRYGKPAEIAAAACFLASDAASFITGHPLALDGGYLAFGFRPAVTPS